MAIEVMTTGVRSGIGKYIHQRLGGIGLSRERSAACMAQARAEGVNTIIHCAFNAAKDVDTQILYNYHSDNVLLTGDLLEIPHKKFIYFSTVDVYPKDNEMHTEEEILKLDQVSGIYGITKLTSESLVKRESENYLILRPTALLGEYIRKNTLLRILDEDPSPVYLSGDSCFNYVLYSDILDFIHFAIQHDVRGVYNLASATNVTLSEVAASVERNVDFGQHVYDVGTISNEKVVATFPAFNQASIEVLRRFIEERHG